MYVFCGIVKQFLESKNYFCELTSSVAGRSLGSNASKHPSRQRAKGSALGSL